MTSPAGDVSALAKSVNSEEREKAIAFFTSAEFLRPYGDDVWRWFPDARPPMSQGDRRAALLTAEAYIHQALDHQLADDGDATRHALEVALGCLKVALGSSSENRVLQ